MPHQFRPSRGRPPSRPQLRPPHAPSGGARSGNQSIATGRGRPVMRRGEDWRSWQELSVRISGLHENVTTLGLYKHFSPAGTIIVIDIHEGRGRAECAATITFCPPPWEAFWESPQGDLKIDLLPKKRSLIHPSPVDPTRSYPERLRLFPEVLRFGFMDTEKSMMPMRTLRSTTTGDIEFTLDLLRRQLDIRFPFEFLRKGLSRAGTMDSFRFSVPFAQLDRIYSFKIKHDRQVLIIPLSSPPAFFRKVRDIGATHDAKDLMWNENRAWLRQTDIVQDREQLKSASVTLRKDNAMIDIGRWTTYYLSFNAQNYRHAFNLICRALSDYNIEIHPLEEMELKERREPPLWKWIDNQKVPTVDALSALSDLQNDSIYLPFQVRYQLEVCLSHGFLNEHNLSRECVERLAAMDATAARNLLERVADAKRRFYDPMEIFNLSGFRSASDRSIPRYCVYTRAATVTPSTVYYATPTVEISNRIVRQYIEHEDRFLRVKFTDEKSRGRINSQDDDSQDEVFTRIKRTMTNGITIGDRHFEFLAFGNSQFREHGAYFFAPSDQLSAADIREWMGDFSHIRTVAKWAARLGQCFSTTRAIHGTRVKVLTIPDVKRNGFTFTDGVGKISPFLAQMIASEFNLPDAFVDPPSLFQFRLGGCKGVLAVAPEARQQEIYIRRSQYKFPAKHEGLEIIRTSSFAAASLNRQIIVVLSTLGVRDQVFTLKLQAVLSDLKEALTNEKTALRLLQKYVDLNQMTLTVAGMILDGFMRVGEPFMMSVLQLWRAWNIKYLKEKARILIEKGAFLLGCVDETATLRGYYSNSDDDSLIHLPQIFLQIPNQEEKGKYKVVTGTCILVRNPSLHPGDIRIVEAVDVPQLHHLKNVVVFPQTGDRDVANMCSGGDLDGDDYLVMWDDDLMPEEINHPAMDYEAQKPVELDRDVTVDDVTSFFVLYMKKDKLGSIANAHLAHADSSDLGVKDERCLRLAQLHSDAVDYPKSGIPARMSRDLRPRRWPHFMEKRKENTYQSNKVLGQLYDQVERAEFVPVYEQFFDERILNAYELDDDVLEKAAKVKELYDSAVRRIMAQHGIRTEFEVWSTFVLEHNQESKDYKFGEEIGNLSRALKDRFRDLCIQKAGGRHFERLGPFVAAMYTVTARQIVTAVAQARNAQSLDSQHPLQRSLDPKKMPAMSFPWLFVSELGKIATGDFSRLERDLKVEQGEKKRSHVKQSGTNEFHTGQDDLETSQGIMHRGDLLELFDDLNDSSHGEKPNGAERERAPSSSNNISRSPSVGQDRSKSHAPSSEPKVGNLDLLGDVPELEPKSDRILRDDNESTSRDPFERDTILKSNSEPADHFSNKGSVTQVDFLDEDLIAIHDEAPMNGTLKAPSPALALDEETALEDSQSQGSEASCASDAKEIAVVSNEDCKPEDTANQSQGNEQKGKDKAEPDDEEKAHVGKVTLQVTGEMTALEKLQALVGGT